MIHYYFGNGKGKTTAAFGLALRCAGQGGKVAIIQFLKSGNSGEVKAIKDIKNIEYINYEEEHGFFCKLTLEEQGIQKEEIRNEYDIACEILKKETFSMLILDEITDTIEIGIVNEEMIINLLKLAKDTELVLTGHKPLHGMMAYFDYCSEIKCLKHPYQNGVSSRKGIEY